MPNETTTTTTTPSVKKNQAKALKYVAMKGAVKEKVAKLHGAPQVDVVTANKNAAAYNVMIATRAAMGEDATSEAVMVRAQAMVNVTGAYMTTKDTLNNTSGVLAELLDKYNATYKGGVSYLQAKHHHAIRLDACNVQASKYDKARACTRATLGDATYVAALCKALNARAIEADLKGNDGKRLKFTSKAVATAFAAWKAANPA